MNLPDLGSTDLTCPTYLAQVLQILSYRDTNLCQKQTPQTVPRKVIGMATALQPHPRGGVLPTSHDPFWRSRSAHLCQIHAPQISLERSSFHLSSLHILRGHLGDPVLSSSSGLTGQMHFTYLSLTSTLGQHRMNLNESKHTFSGQPTSACLGFNRYYRQILDTI